MEDLDFRLRSAMKDAATALVPFSEAAAVQSLSGKRAARRPQLWAGAGVVATAAAVAVGLLVTGSDNPAPGMLPSASAVRLGAAVTHLPYLAQGLTSWTSGVSFSSSMNGWAVGTRCASAKERNCPTILAHTVDAGRTWTLAPSTPTLSSTDRVLAGSKGLWAISDSDKQLWFSEDGARTWSKVMTAAIASARVVNGKLVAYVHGSQDKAISVCTVTVSRVVYDGSARVSSEHLSDDVFGGFTASSMGADGSIWRSRPNTHACNGDMVANGSPKMEVAPPGKDFGGLHNPASPSSGAWDLAPVSGSTAYTLVGENIEETTDGGSSWQTVGSVSDTNVMVGPVLTALSGNRLLIDAGPFFADLQVFVRNADGSLGESLAVGAPPKPPAGTKSFSYDAPEVDASVNPMPNEIGLLFRGRFVLSTDAGRTWHLQGALPG